MVMDGLFISSVIYKIIMDGIEIDTKIVNGVRVQNDSILLFSCSDILMVIFIFEIIMNVEIIIRFIVHIIIKWSLNIIRCSSVLEFGFWNDLFMFVGIICI